MLCVHPKFGPWIALRAALVLDMPALLTESDASPISNPLSDSDEENLVNILNDALSFTNPQHHPHLRYASSSLRALYSEFVCYSRLRSPFRVSSPVEVHDRQQQELLRLRIAAEKDGQVKFRYDKHQLAYHYSMRKGSLQQPMGWRALVRCVNVMRDDCVHLVWVQCHIAHSTSHLFIFTGLPCDHIRTSQSSRSSSRDSSSIDICTCPPAIFSGPKRECARPSPIGDGAESHC